MPKSDAIEWLTSLEPLVSRMRALSAGGVHRVMIGLAGPPGAGKSTLAQALVDGLAPDRAMAIPMDGYHLAAEVIAGTELQHRRGAIDTYDAAGFGHLLERLRRRDEDVVYAPRYVREIEDPIAAAIAVSRDVGHLVVEGNYLLADEPIWRSARDRLDEVWYIDIEPDERLSRLVARHVAFGKSQDEAVFWSHGSDEVNARLIDSGRGYADLVINVEGIEILGELSG